MTRFTQLSEVVRRYGARRFFYGSSVQSAPLRNACSSMIIRIATIFYGAVRCVFFFLIILPYGAVRCGAEFLFSRILRCGAVRFCQRQNRTVRCGAVTPHHTAPHRKKNPHRKKPWFISIYMHTESAAAAAAAASAALLLLLQQQCCCFLLLFVIVCRMAKFGRYWFIESDPNVFSPFIQKRFIFDVVPLGSTVSHICTVSICLRVHPR